MSDGDKTPSVADVMKLREMVKEKYQERLATGQEEFDERDLHKFETSNLWPENFLINTEGDFNKAAQQLYDMLAWRKDFGTNDITEKDFDPEFLQDSEFFIRGHDLDGYLMLMFFSAKHFKGKVSPEVYAKNFVYWAERTFRMSSNHKATFVMDFANFSMSNLDLDYVRTIITTFRNYYPNTLNHILILEMPFMLTATLQIMKKLLPRQAVKVLKTVSKKNIRKYVDEDNMLVAWGGKDDFVYQFESEFGSQKDLSNGLSNNNSEQQANMNLVHRKVHFANNLSESPSPMSELSTSSFETRIDMLQLSPAETIVFQKNLNNELTGNVHILNVSKKAVTYKVKTTAPDKYRVRPSSGTLSPMTSANINVVIQKGQLIAPVNKDKFLVMCMALPEGEPLTADEIANMWKEVTANSPEVEQHRLKCTMPLNVTTAIINNADMMSTDHYSESIIGMTSSNMIHNGIKQPLPVNQQHLHATINQLSETVNHLNQQVKTQQSLQWITIFLFVMISIAIVYILKMEIQNSNSQYCIDK